MKKEISKLIKHTSKINVYKKRPERTSEGRKEITSGVFNLDNFKGLGGIYYIYEEGKLVYIGDATNDIKRTSTRHFQGWNDSNQLDRYSYREDVLNGKEYQIKFSIYEDAIERSEEIRRIQKLLISNKKPRDNKDQYYNFYNTKFSREEKTNINQEIETYNNGENVSSHDFYNETKKNVVEIPTGEDAPF